ncbi:MAG TPA: lysylphosphatidylglycerol synthase transmembrane domain-containing protein [Niabella sp.]|nr:lysylphosphatidylglycerol synthase transmembrane domain-containing protein [Niabella sp.]HOZ95730.1 lysylphosphatidylglycerol synthase transmembrane domain-containing protein [Niabella sp.]HQW15973.1 lysylphosphatidylglycerol synthase transmembrane domain-containing protein [Niabella sp.]HQX21174.1 lysylphosphatidylglycerol synthase transmembrane domain-containing protein [Niabella sp.]HQX40735.1 lysylphosphatidylglycerol synthase transmembrane domain-containing protein [Niabella sp.]
MARKIATIIRYCFFLGLGVFFIFWSLKGLTPGDMKSISQALQQGNYWFILPGIFVMLLSHWVRALRWKLLMEPLGYQPQKLNIFFALMAGYLANMAIPRLGEVLRCSLMSKYEKVPFDKLIGTVIVERIIDTITLGLLFLLAILIQPDLYQRIVETFFADTTVNSGKIGLYLLIFLIVVAIILSLIFLFNKNKKSNVEIVIKSTIKNIWQGVNSIRTLKRKGTFILYSLIIWALYIACVYFGFQMLTETNHLGLTEAITVLSAGTLGIIATPGGIGAYAFLVQKTLNLYQVSSGIGLTTGWLLWFLQTFLVLITGMISFLGLPLYNKKSSKA